VTFMYDLAAETLATQRDFALQVADLFKPAATASVWCPSGAVPLRAAPLVASHRRCLCQADPV